MSFSFAATPHKNLLSTTSSSKIQEMRDVVNVFIEKLATENPARKIKPKLQKTIYYLLHPRHMRRQCRCDVIYAFIDSPHYADALLVQSMYNIVNVQSPHHRGAKRVGLVIWKRIILFVYAEVFSNITSHYPRQPLISYGFVKRCSMWREGALLTSLQRSSVRGKVG